MKPQKPKSLVLDQLTAIGGIGTGEIVPRSIEWNGQKLDLFFRDLPGGKVQAMLRKGVDADPEIVASTLCCADGTPAMDIDQANELKLTLRQAIVLEAMNVFGFTKEARESAKKG